jgi:hypothetical protein
MDLQKTIDKYNLHSINIEGDLIISKNELKAIINEAQAEKLILSGVVKSLTNKKAMSFSEWKLIKFNYNNGLYNDLLEKRKFYTQAQILKKYNDEILN